LNYLKSPFFEGSILDKVIGKIRREKAKKRKRERKETKRLEKRIENLESAMSQKRKNF